MSTSKRTLLTRLDHILALKLADEPQIKEMIAQLDAGELPDFIDGRYLLVQESDDGVAIETAEDLDEAKVAIEAFLYHDACHHLRLVSLYDLDHGKAIGLVRQDSLRTIIIP